MKKLEVSKNDLEYNLSEINNIIDGKNTNIIAVVKANGMGLDLVKYSKFLIEKGIKILAVANIYEAIKLREANIKEEILMLTPVSLKNELKELIQNDITITIGSYEELQLSEEICKELDKKTNAHIKIDTGFGRYGFLYNEKEIIVETLKRSNLVNICGIYTHFSNAIDEKCTRLQFDRFISVINYVEKNGYSIPNKHCSASTAFLKYPDMRLDSVRLRINNTRKNTTRKK